MTELVVKIDLKDMLDQVQAEVVTKEVVPEGYACMYCAREDGKHESSCPHYQRTVEDA